MTNHLADPARRRWGALCATAAAAILLPGCVIAPARLPYDLADDGPFVMQEPPPLYAEQPGYAPAVGYIWIGGFWNWAGSRHVWVPGRWAAPRRGYAWQPHRWHRHGRGWRQAPGHWQRWR